MEDNNTIKSKVPSCMIIKVESDDHTNIDDKIMTDNYVAHSYIANGTNGKHIFIFILDLNKQNFPKQLDLCFSIGLNWKNNNYPTDQHHFVHNIKESNFKRLILSYGSCRPNIKFP